MTNLEIGELELIQAQTQADLLKVLLGEQIEKRATLSAAGADTTAVDSIIADIEEDISEIEEEARKYDYLINPRKRPELCRQCNDSGYNENLPTGYPCPTCKLPLTKNRPLDGTAHWIIDANESQVLPIGEVPQ